MKRQRISVLLIVFTLIISTIAVCKYPVQTYADNGLTRGEWIHNLVETFNMTIDGELVPDDYYEDIVDSTYYEDILTAVYFGVIDLQAGEDFEPDSGVTREFAASTVNYCLGYQLEEETYTMNDSAALQYPNDDQIAVNRGWFELVDGNYMPDQLVTEAEKNAIFQDVETVWNSTEVDENHEDVLDVAEGVIEVPEETEVAIDEEAGTVTISDTSLTIHNGDSFVVYPNGIPNAYHAENVSVVDDRIIITTQEASGDEVFDELDAEGIVDVDLGDFIAASDDIEVTMIEEDESIVGASSNYTLGQRVRFAAGTKTKKIKGLSIRKKIDAGGGKYVYLDVELKNVNLEYKLKYHDIYVAVNGDATVECGAGAAASFTLPLGSIPITGLGSIQVFLNYTIDGNAAIIFNADYVVGFQYNDYDGWRFVKNFHAHDMVAAVNVNAGISCSISLKVGVSGIVSGEAYAEVGLKGKMNMKVYSDGNKPSRCTTISVYMFAEVGVSAEVPLVKKYHKSITIFNEKNSPLKIYYHIEDGVAVDTCARDNAAVGSGKRHYTTKNYASNGSHSGTGKNTFSMSSSNCLIWTSIPEVFNYELDEDNNATITKYNGSAYYVTIPEEIDGYPVKGIGSEAFKGNNSIRSVIIPDGIEKIGASAFENCSNLQRAFLSNSITTIEGFAFESCKQLVDIELPSNIVSIGENAFFDCDSIVRINIPKSLRECGFDDYTVFVTISRSVFYNCSSLKTVDFEEGITNVPDYLFAFCDGLENIVLPDTITSIGNSSFYKCSNLQSIFIPSSVTSINSSAFYNCSKLNEVDLPNHLVYLGKNSFANCVSIQKITIPKSIEECDYETYSYSRSPFYGCNSLSEISYEEGIKKIPDGLFAFCYGLVTTDIPSSVTEIGAHSFYGCTNLTKVIIPDSVTQINHYAFCNCKKLSGVTLPSNLKSIGYQSFGSCSALTSIIIPNTLEQSGNAFVNCENLKTAIIQDGITKIPSGLFCDCIGLEEVNIPQSVIIIESNAFSGTGIKEIELSDTITDIRSGIFKDCKKLSKVKIKGNIDSLPSSIFEGCEKLTVVELPESIKIIESYAFSDCAELKTLELAENTKIIKGYSFYGCEKLQAIAFTENIESIGSSAFYKCSSLTDVQLNDNLISIDNYAFEYCTSLESITIPNNVKTIGSYCFAYCDKLSTVNLGAGVTAIPTYAFYEDPALVSVVLPQQVTTVNNYAFGNCTKLTDVTMNRKVNSVSTNAFSYPAKMTIHGVKGTYAETFANNNSIHFDELNVPAVSIALNSNELSLGKNQTFQLAAAITPNNSTDELTYTSTDEDVITVSENGLITAKAIGDASIIVMAGDVIETCDVTVYQPVSYVYLNYSSYTMTIKDTLQLEASISPSDANNKNVSWKSSDSTVATVSSKGLVTAKAYGTATITVTTEDGNKTRTCTITVAPISVEKISLDTNKITIGIGESYTLKSTITPSNATNKTVTWTSSKPAVATVTNGKVTAVSKGTSVIIVKTQDGNKTASCTVTVTEELAKYQLTYTLNGGSMPTGVTNPTEYTYDTATITLNNPVRTGYTFGGWYTDAGFASGTKVTNIPQGSSGDKTFYAKWTKTKYTITYNLNSGKNNSANPASYYVTTDTITLAAPTRTGYTFAGWYSDSAFKTKVTKIAKGSTGNKTLYAKWSPNQYTIKYNGNGSTSGFMTEKTGCKYGTSYTLAANAFKKKGYTFTGWNTKANGTGTVYANKASVKNLSAASGGSVTLYAQWKKTKYTITYKLNGGKNNSSNPASYYVTTSTITLAKPTRTGYTFAGWYSDSSFKTKVTKITKGSTGNKTLYAKWTANKYTIKYNGNGATSGTMKNQTGCKYGTSYTLSANAYKKTGYTFAGWNTKKDGSGTTYKNKASVKNLTGKNGGTVTLYAQWKKK